MQRVILQIRLSRRWVEGSPESVASLASYLYSLYSFLGLADPSALFGWSIYNDATTGAPYLMLIENTVGPDKSGKEEPKSKTVLVVTKPEEHERPALSEDELDPDL